MEINVLIGAIILCLLSSSIGFKKTVWFISIGYTLSILMLSLITSLFFRESLQFFNYFQLLGIAIWALRLGYFLVVRERNEVYNSAVKDQLNSSQQLSIPIKISIWFGVSILYVCIFFPAILAASKAQGFATSILIWIGLCVLWLGVVLEAAADYQKSVFKKHQPKQFCNTGLYAWVRCPNYLGEILVWTGNFIIGIAFYNCWWHWAIALVGFVCIVLIMIGSTKRLEAKQAERYGNDITFQQYIKKVPVLFPWLPIYSLKNVKVYLE